MAKYTGPTTQQLIPVKEIRDGIIVLQDDSLRAVLVASAINMQLKSADEQEAVIYQFQSFLNSLEFPVQISIQSRKQDIKPYLNKLEERIKQQKEELLRLQTKEYIEFIKWFTDSVNVMSKRFFIVVPYTGALNTKINKGGGFLDFLKPKNSSKSFREATSRFEEQRSQIEQRVAIIRDGLGRLGVRAKQLNTEQAIEVYYNMFNPGENHRSIPKKTY